MDGSIDSKTSATIGAAVSALFGVLGVLLLAVSLSGCEPLDSDTKDQDPGKPSFGNRTVPTQHYVAGSAIPHLDLPAATGGDGALTYSLTSVPAGLSFDAGTRTLSGVPANPGGHTLKYLVADRDGDTDELSFRVDANPFTTVYWVDHEGVHAKGVDGTKRRDVLTRGNWIGVFALDRDSKYPGLYYADGLTIRRVHLDGGAAQTVAKAEQPVSAITVDSNNDALLWVEVENSYDTVSEISTTNSKVHRVHLDGGPRRIVVDVPGQGVSSIAVDSANGMLYGSGIVYGSSSGSIDRSTVWRTNLDRSSPSPEQIIEVAGKGIIPVAVDSVKERVYWGEYSFDSDGSLSGKVRSANLDGGRPNDIVEGGAIVAVAIDHPNEWLYYLEYSSLTSVRIRRATLDGSAVEGVLDIVDLSMGFSIAVDSIGKRLYWLFSTQTSSGIRRANLDGSGRADFIANKIRDFSYGRLALDVLRGSVYWVKTDWGDECGSDSYSIWTADLDGSNDGVVIQNLDGEPEFLEFDVVDRKLYWYESIYDWEDSQDGGCSRTYQGAKIRSADLDGGGAQELIRLSNERRAARTIELDAVERELYWTERTDSAYAIRRSNLDGTDPETVVDDIRRRPVGIAIDIVGRKLFWNTWNGGVFRADLDDPVQEPVENAIAGVGQLHAVDGSTGKMYYELEPTQPQDEYTVAIGQANLDGSGARILVDDLDSVGQLVLGVAPPAPLDGSDARYRTSFRRHGSRGSVEPNVHSRRTTRDGALGWTGQSTE